MCCLPAESESAVSHSQLLQVLRLSLRAACTQAPLFLGQPMSHVRPFLVISAPLRKLYEVFALDLPAGMTENVRFPLWFDFRLCPILFPFPFLSQIIICNKHLSPKHYSGIYFRRNPTYGNFLIHLFFITSLYYLYHALIFLEQTMALVVAIHFFNQPTDFHVRITYLNIKVYNTV